MTDFSEHIKPLARGPRSRTDLTRDAASDAMTQLLQGNASHEQAAAFLALLRVKGETTDEFIGFVTAARAFLPTPVAKRTKVDIDWPCYAGKKRQPSWFLLAAKLLAQNGFRILLHDAPAASDSRCYARELLDALDISRASSLDEAANQIGEYGITWLGLEHFSPKLVELLALREQLGVRSIVNSLVRCLNPLKASLSVQSVFHPDYLDLHTETARQLGDDRTLIFKGDGGEAEIRPYANTRLTLVQNGNETQVTLPALTDKPNNETPSSEALQSLWRGSPSPHGEAAVIQTTAAILWASGRVDDLDTARQHARQLWQNRSPQ
jgi:anthranilate phosphoribosyltransferase